MSSNENHPENMENIEEILKLWAPTVINLVERQARTDFLLTLLEDHGYFPKGFNELGDIILDKLRTHGDIEAVREEALKTKVIPWDYAKKVGRLKTKLHKTDAGIASIARRLLL